MNVTTLRRLGWDAHLAEAYQRHDRPGHWPARVSRVERGVCTLLGAGEVRRASVAGHLLAAAACDRSRLPCPGDWVVVRTWPDRRWTIEAVLPRRGTVWRASQPVPVASNVDIMVVVDTSRCVESDFVRELRALVAAGRTVGLMGADAPSRGRLVTKLAGTAVLMPATDALVPLPGGGAAIATDGDRFDVELGGPGLGDSDPRDADDSGPRGTGDTGPRGIGGIAFPATGGVGPRGEIGPRDIGVGDFGPLDTGDAPSSSASPPWRRRSLADRSAMA